MLIVSGTKFLWRVSLKFEVCLATSRFHCHRSYHPLSARHERDEDVNAACRSSFKTYSSDIIALYIVTRKPGNWAWIRSSMALRIDTCRGAGKKRRGADMSWPRINPNRQLQDDRITGAATPVYPPVSGPMRKHNSSSGEFVNLPAAPSTTDLVVAVVVFGVVVCAYVRILKYCMKQKKTTAHCVSIPDQASQLDNRQIDAAAPRLHAASRVPSGRMQSHGRGLMSLRSHVLGSLDVCVYACVISLFYAPLMHRIVSSVKFLFFDKKNVIKKFVKNQTCY